jgi:hypothetical protein
MLKPLLSSSSFDSLLRDLTTQQTGAHREIVFASLQKERIQTAAVLNRAQGSCGNAQTEALAERIGNQRNLAEVREEPTLGSVVGVADVVARLDALAGQFAYTGHGYTYLLSSVLPTARYPAKSGQQSNWQ